VNTKVEAAQAGRQCTSYNRQLALHCSEVLSRSLAAAHGGRYCCDCPACLPPAHLPLQAAARTNDLAGDGTTTATILSAAMIAEGMKIVAAGANPVQVGRRSSWQAPTVLIRVTWSTCTASARP
jgi:hypothetical protein